MTEFPFRIVSRALLSTTTAMIACVPSMQPVRPFTTAEDRAAASRASDLQLPDDLPPIVAPGAAPGQSPAAPVAVAAAGDGCQERYGGTWSAMWYPEITASTNEKYYRDLAGAVLAAVAQEIPRRGLEAELMYCSGVDYVVDVLRSALAKVAHCELVERSGRAILEGYAPSVKQCAEVTASRIPDAGQRRERLAAAQVRVGELFQDVWRQEASNAAMASFSTMTAQRQFAEARESARDEIRDSNHRAQRAAESRAGNSAVVPTWIRQSVTNPSLWSVETVP